MHRLLILLTRRVALPRPLSPLLALSCLLLNRHTSLHCNWLQCNARTYGEFEKTRASQVPCCPSVSLNPTPMLSSPSTPIRVRSEVSEQCTFFLLLALLLSPHRYTLLTELPLPLSHSLSSPSSLSFTRPSPHALLLMPSSSCSPSPRPHRYSSSTVLHLSVYRALSSPLSLSLALSIPHAIAPIRFLADGTPLKSLAVRMCHRMPRPPASSPSPPPPSEYDLPRTLQYRTSWVLLPMKFCTANTARFVPLSLTLPVPALTDILR